MALKPSTEDWTMHRYKNYVAWFLGGVFVVNSIPHIINGVSGRSFPTPFSTTPGRLSPGVLPPPSAFSPPWVNVLWGVFMLIIGYLLVCRVGTFSLRRTRDAIAFGSGAVLIALMLAFAFGPLYAGR
jgi:hypothetical protein